MTLPSLLITRPHASAVRFVAGLNGDIRQNAKIVVSPLLEIVPTSVQPDVSAYCGAIFTSANAIVLAPEGKHRPAYCVGHSTAERAKIAGWRVLAEEQTAEKLLERLNVLRPAGPLVHLAGRHRRGDLAARLTALGTPTDIKVLYDQVLVPLSAEAHAVLNGGDTVVVPLFSPRLAVQFIGQASHLQNVIIVAMSEAVAQCCRGSGAMRILSAAEPTGQEMLRSVEKVMCDTSLA